MGSLVSTSASSSSNGGDEAVASWKQSQSLTFSGEVSQTNWGTVGASSAMNDSGHIITAWGQSNGGSYWKVFYAYFDGSSWTRPASLADSISPDAINGAQSIQPKVAINNNGHMAIAWVQSDSSGYRQVYVSQFNGSSWDHPDSLSDNLSPDGESITDNDALNISINNNNKILVSWVQSDGSDNQVFYSLFDGSTWDNPSNLTDNISFDGEPCLPYISSVINDNDNIIIIWSQYDGAFYQIFYSQYDGTSWDHPSSLADNISPDGADASVGSLEVDMNENDVAVISWTQSNGVDAQVYYSKFDGTSWDHPNNLADNISPDNRSATVISLDIDNNNKIVIAWQQNNLANRSQLFYSYYDGTSWDHPADLNDNISPDGQNALLPNAAINDNGKIIIAWQQHDGANYQTFMSYFDGTSWDHPADLTDNISPDGYSVSALSIAQGNSNDILIAWHQFNGSTNDQLYQSYFDGSSWTHPTSISDTFSMEAQQISEYVAAANEQGKKIIVWAQSDGSNDQVYMSYYNGSSWDYPNNISDNISPDGEDVFNPNVAMDENGKIVITWVQNDGSNDQVYMSYFDGTAWDHPANLADNISPDGEDIDSEVSIAMNDSGKIVLSWVQSDGSETQTFMSYFDGTSWDHPANLADNISPDGEDVDSEVSLAMNDSGKIILSWIQSDGSNNQVYMSYFDGTSWDHPANLADNISPDGEDVDNEPVLAMTAAGKIIIAWEQEDGSANQVYGAYYDGSSWDLPVNAADSILPTGALTCQHPKVFAGETKIFTLAVCNDGNKNRLYAASNENNFVLVDDDYISDENESIIYLSSSSQILSDDFVFVIYYSSMNSATHFPIRSVSWEI